MTGAASWLARTALLVLSLLVTLSLVGSIATIAPGASAPHPEPRNASLPAQALPDTPPRPAARPRSPMPLSAPGDTDRSAEMALVPAARPDADDPLRWLEPLTYALVALAGLMIVAVALLWRIADTLSHRR